MKTASDVGKRIEAYIQRHDWPGARRLIQSQLRREPGDHWLLTRLSLTYYEQYDYRRALYITKKAIKRAPRCPLVLWDHAGALHMLNCQREAIAIYRRLVARGPRSIATGECGEGLAQARGLVSDSLYRLGQCYADIGRPKTAVVMLKKALAMRGPGCHSIYPLPEVRTKANQIRRGMHVV